jgi:hypothetical protein
MGRVSTAPRPSRARKRSGELPTSHAPPPDAAMKAPKGAGARARSAAASSTASPEKAADTRRARLT